MSMARGLSRGAIGVLWAMAALGGAGCITTGSGGPDGTPVVADAGLPDALPPGPATALFELPRGAGHPAEYYALPFPNDLRVRADGTLDLTDHIRPNAILVRYLDLFQTEFNGFGTNSASFFRFAGEIDPTTLPVDPAASLDAAASVYLVNVDPASAHKGERTPLRFRFSPGGGVSIGPDWLSVLPYPGFPLRAKTTYAVIVTSRVHATSGAPIARSADFDAVMSTAASTDAAVTAARTVYAPLLAFLDAPGGDERADVIAANLFTTQDPTSQMAAIRKVIYRDVPAPTAIGLTDNGNHGSFELYEGTYMGPNFQTGDPPYPMAGDGGEIVNDAAGDPKVQRMESIRFAVTAPTGPSPAGGWPIVLYAHGTGGDFLSFFNDGTAGRMADQGLAVISIDQVLHGPRNPHGDPELAFFNFNNPVAARDNTKQGALDDFQLVRLAETLTVPLPAPMTGNATFDPSRMYFMGHSQGGLTGPPFLAYEPKIRGAVLSGAGGLIYFSLLNKTQPVDIRSLVGTLVTDYPLDEFNNLLALVQMFLESSDPVNYGPLLVREPVAGVGAKDIYQSEGFVDHYAPDPDIEAFGVSIGVAPVAPIIQAVPGFTLRQLSTRTAPVMDNDNGRTAVFLQYTATAGSDGHFVVFDVPAAQKQHADFLGTLAKSGTATLVAP